MSKNWTIVPGELSQKFPTATKLSNSNKNFQFQLLFPAIRKPIIWLMPVGYAPLVYYELQEIILKIFVWILFPEMTLETPKIFFQNSSKSLRVD